MKAMSNKGRYSDYLKSTYIRYAFSIVGLTFALFVIFMFLDLFYTTIKDNQRCNALVYHVVSRESESYARDLGPIAASGEAREALAPKGDATAFYRKLYGYCAHRAIKPVFTLFDAEGRIVATNLYYPNKIAYERSPKIKDSLILAHDDREGVYRGYSGIRLEGRQSTSFLFVQCVRDEEGIIGYLSLDWLDESVDAAIRRNSADIIALTDRFDNAFYATSQSILNGMGKCRLPWKGHMTTVDDKPYYGIVTNLPESQINIITLSSMWTQRQISLYTVFFSLSLSLLIVCLVLILANKVSSNNARFIDELLNAVAECGKGNTDYRIETVTFEEFQALYDAFNGMMGQLELSVARNKELMERKRLMEVKHLEEQFNPHFVFNVMETIKYETMINPEKAVAMIVSFGNLMRYSVNCGSSEIVALKTDIAYVKDYLKLQKVRYGRRLGYSIDIEPALLDHKIPKLLIQPIVENCLTHGARDQKHINIKIEARRDEESIAFSIEDDGRGIGRAELEAIKASLAEDSAIPEHIGIYNVHKVLNLLYGDPFGVSIDSEEGRGTHVMLTMPVQSRGGHA
jgi:two-component system sensor histidine kinase YesM